MVGYTHQEFKELYKLHITILVSVHRFINDRHLRQIKLHLDDSRRNETSDAFEDLFCRVDRKANILLELVEGSHDSLQVEVHELIVFLEPDILRSEDIKTDRYLVWLFLGKEWNDLPAEELTKNDAEGADSTDTVLVLNFKVSFDSQEKYFSKFDSVDQDIFILWYLHSFLALM